MDSHTHFLFPFFLALILAKLQILPVSLAVLAGVIGVIIDIDHYVEHILHQKKNRFSISSTWNNSMKYHRFAQRSFIHEGLGIGIISLLLLPLLILNVQYFLAISLGYYTHIFLDYIKVKKPHYLNLKLGKLYFRETHTELVFDVILFVGIILILQSL